MRKMSKFASAKLIHAKINLAKINLLKLTNVRKENEYCTCVNASTLSYCFTRNSNSKQYDWFLMCKQDSLLDR